MIKTTYEYKWFLFETHIFVYIKKLNIRNQTDSLYKVYWFKDTPSSFALFESSLCRVFGILITNFPLYSFESNGIGILIPLASLVSI